MKKEHKILVGAVLAATILTALVTSLVFVKNKKINQPSAVTVTNTPVAVQTNAPAVSQVDLLAAEVKALKAANEEREAKVKRLLALNEEVRREREMLTNAVIVPVTVNVTNSPPSVTINGAIHIGGSSGQQAPSKETQKGGAVLMEKSQKSKTRTPMYVVTNYTSSVTTTGTNTSSVVNTQVQTFLKPQRRWSVLGLLIGEKDPISTSVPSGQSVQQGYPAPQITVVESPYPYGYGYRSPYQPVYSGYGSSEKRLFGYRFKSR